MEREIFREDIANNKYLQEDIRTVHAEIKQIISNRYVILTASITLLGLYLTCVTQFDKFIFLSKIIQPPYLFSVFFSLILLMFGFYLNILTKQLFCLSGFLVALNASVYEKYWGKFPRNKLSGYSFAQKICFVIIVISMNFFSFIVVYCKEPAISCKDILIPLLSVIVYVLLQELIQECIISKKRKRRFIDEWKELLHDRADLHEY